MILKTSPLAAALLTQTAAADTKRDYHIPAQTLNQALLAFGQQSGQPLLYDTALTEHLQSRALIGRYDTDAALATLLTDAPLQAVATDAGSLTLQPKARPMTVADNGRRASTTLPKVTVVGSAEYDG